VLDLTGYLLTSLVFFCGSFTQSIIGFGFNIIGVPFLAMLAGTQTAVAAVSIASFLNCVYVLYNVKKTTGESLPLNLGRFAPLLGMGLIGSFSGTFLLVGLDASVVLVWLGILLLLFVLTNDLRKNWRPTPRQEKPAAYIMGLLTGVLAGLAGISGPTLVPYLHALKLEKLEFVFYLNLLFIFFGLFSFASYASLGIYTWERVGLGFSLIPVSLLGSWVGAQVRNKVSQEWFSRLILLVLFVTALDLIRRGLHLF
jgi:uncharacterized protein